jgi:HAD superfamily hydrolase (TIGR01509 family)
VVTIASGKNELGLAVFLDLDQTLVMTHAIESLRKKRDWPSVYQAFHKTHLPPGTKAFIRQLGTLAKVGVVTNSPRSYAVRLLTHHGLNVPVLVAYHDVKNHKPHPDPILKAAELVRLPIQRCIHVGDSVTDIEASVRAGSITIAVEWGSSDTISTEQVQFFARNWDEVLEFIRSTAAALN